MSRQLLGGRYRLQGLLGQGGAATVWRAQDLHLQREVAVKVLKADALAEPDAREQLGREARTLARIAHPNIVAVHDFDVQVATPYLVMELVGGESLATVLTRGRLPVPRAVAIGLQVCAALSAAHEVGVLHRDVKPANLLVMPDGTVKVCDFGIARSTAAAVVPDPGTVSGTTEYLAPERASGGAGDTRADLYALGCVLYAMLAGTPPFTNRNHVRVLYQHLHQEPRPLAEIREDVPEQLEALVLDLLAKRPVDRPASAQAVRVRLLALTDAAATAGAGPATEAAGTTVATDAAGTTVATDAAVLTGATAATGPAGATGGATAGIVPAFTPGLVPVPGTGQVPAPEPDRADTRIMPRARAGHRRERWPVPRWALLPLIVPVALGLLLAVHGGDGSAPDAGHTPAPPLALMPTGGPDWAGAQASGPPSDRGPSGAAAATTAAGTPPRAMAGRPTTPVQQVAALEAVIGQQANAGQLDPAAANSLSTSLNDVIRRLGKGQTAKAAGRVNQLQQQLSVLAANQRVSLSGYQVLTAGFNRLAESISVTGAAAD